jgi:hypothetical protein
MLRCAVTGGIHRCPGSKDRKRGISVIASQQTPVKFHSQLVSKKSLTS